MSETIGTEPGLKELLLKLHKGAFASCNAKTTGLVLGLFPGWTIEKADFVKQSDQLGHRDGFKAETQVSLERYSVLAKQMRSYTATLHALGNRSGDNPVRLFERCSDQEETMALHANVAKFVVDALPEPKKAKADAYYVMNLTTPEKVAKGDDHEWTFSFDLFRKCRGHRITTPTGQTFEVCGATNVLGYTGAQGFDAFFKWAFANTDLETLINGKLGLNKHIPASERPRVPVGGQTIGTCAICSRSQVVRNGKMVLHGYQRPGYGFIVGDCFGVAYDPYETSAEACIAYIPVLKDYKTRQQTRLADLDEGRITQFSETKRNYRTNKDEVITIVKGDVKFPAMLREAIRDVKGQIELIDGSIVEMQQRIQNWKPGTLRRNEGVTE